jgi:glucose/arabinose dehydrogenase
LIAYIHEMTTRSVDPQPREEQPLPVGIQHSEDYAYRIEPVAAGLDVPWSMAFLPDGRMLVTERVGRLRVIDHGKLQPEPIRDVPPVVVRDEAGLMSVVADPDFAQNGWIYLSLSDPGPDDSAMTKIVRGRLRDGAFVDQQTVFAIPRAQYQRNYVLFGGRMVFQGDYLFFSVGERGMHDGITGQAQDLTRPNGKIHRVFRDGRVPPDNPFVHQAGAFASIWAYGMRNPQGLAIDPRNGALWETEHGPRGGDELNRVRRGRNYGWPVITYGMNYDGTPVSAKTAQRGMEQPVLDAVDRDQRDRVLSRGPISQMEKQPVPRFARAAEVPAARRRGRPRGASRGGVSRARPRARYQDGAGRVALRRARIDRETRPHRAFGAGGVNGPAPGCHPESDPTWGDAAGLRA